MVEPTINIESPNIQVDAPVNIGGFAEGIRDRLVEIVQKVREGDDEVMTAIFLGTAFVVAGVFVWRRL